MEEFIQLNKQEYSFIGKDSKYKGEFSFQGTTYISGEIEGNIIQEKSHKILIDVTARIFGTIFCGDITIKGVVNGDIESAGTIKIEPSAKVTGKISAKNLIIAPGAKVNISGNAESKDSNSEV